MRTTLTIDDAVVRQLMEVARRAGKSFQAVVNETLRTGLDQGRTTRPEAVAMGEVVGAYDLDKAVELAASLEDDEIVQKLKQGK